MKTVVVTGAGGYIGGQTAIVFHNAGYNVIGIDKKEPAVHIRKCFSKFLVSDFSSEEALYVIEKAGPDAIVHCAGTSLVGPSVHNPKLYYQNNFVATKKLLDFLIEKELSTKVIFSSSAATYGEPIMVPCREEDPPMPLSPYGESKLMVEMMLQSYKKAYHQDFVAFRYFNVCGADPEGNHGQEDNATHIIARILESIKQEQEFTLYGTNYPTPDGTCIRDYIHVHDLAKAHLLAAEKYNVQGIYNLGTGTGYSNKQIIETAFEITEKTATVKEGPIREGDPAVLTCTAEKFHNATSWTPEYNLNSIIQHAWDWYNREL